MLPAPAEAHKKTCTKEVYKEEYIPGKKNKPGRIESKWITKEIPCKVTIIMGMVMGMVGNTFTSTTYDGTLHSHGHRHGEWS